MKIITTIIFLYISTFCHGQIDKELNKLPFPIKSPDELPVIHITFEGISRYAFTEPATKHLMMVAVRKSECEEEVQFYQNRLGLYKELKEVQDSVNMKLKFENKALWNENREKDLRIKNVQAQGDVWKKRFKSQRRQKWLIISGAGVVISLETFVILKLVLD